MRTHVLGTIQIRPSKLHGKDMNHTCDIITGVDKIINQLMDVSGGRAESGES